MISVEELQTLENGLKGNFYGLKGNLYGLEGNCFWFKGNCNG